MAIHAGPPVWAIRNSPARDTSLLIITYDEHGGFYDWAVPPATTPPDDGSPGTYNQWGFTFAQPHPGTDAPTRLNYPAPPTLRAAIDPQTAQASPSEPIPDSGSLPGFLQILLKTDLELSTTPQERDEAQARHAAVMRCPELSGQGSNRIFLERKGKGSPAKGQDLFS